MASSCAEVTSDEQADRRRGACRGWKPDPGVHRVAKRGVEGEGQKVFARDDVHGDPALQLTIAAAPEITRAVLGRIESLPAPDTST